LIGVTCWSESSETIHRLTARSVGSASASFSISNGSSTLTSPAVKGRAHPRPGALAGSGDIAVERHLHLDHQVEVVHPAAGIGRTFAQRREQRIAVEIAVCRWCK
jgi:hypothetical protein